ncbi:LysR substrate-binding domain-containing protein [Bdellovibrio sp. HCB337]|uniref:LysR substrate-binding domain-containing protein n=1 Tax=Bdellovibrio sp. HCB337 TaxID=3394358 RepID=UPI0039A68B56
MTKYLISPEDCLILVAIQQNTSLRSAAESLNCDAGGLLRKVQRISDDHGLLSKVDGKWKLTQEGQALVAWTQESILSQQELMKSSVHLRIASTAWFAEQILIPASPELQRTFGGRVKIQYLTPDVGLEKSLIMGESDFVVACHAPENPSIAHKQLQPEPWSVIVSPSVISKSRKTLSMDLLKDIPLVRHRELNPEVFLADEVAANPPEALTMDNLIGVRSAVLSGLGWSLVPTALVLRELADKKLLDIQCKINMDRKVCIWWLRNNLHERKQHASFCKWVAEACSVL